MIDFESLGTSIAILSKADPIAALATGVLTGIFGKIFFDKKKTTAKEKAENKKTLGKVIKLKEKKNVRPTEQDTE